MSDEINLRHRSKAEPGRYLRTQAAKPAACDVVYEPQSPVIGRRVLTTGSPSRDQTYTLSVTARA